jgi:hypothetical protein
MTEKKLKAKTTVGAVGPSLEESSGFGGALKTDEELFEPEILNPTSTVGKLEERSKALEALVHEILQDPRIPKGVRDSYIHKLVSM